MRALTLKQVDADHIAVNLGYLISYAETRDHGDDWSAALSALRLALHFLSPMMKPEAEESA